MSKIIKSFLFAFKGLAYAFKTQLNFRVHCFFTVVVIVLGLYTQPNFKEWLWISLAIALVIILELVNTALEVLVDLISPEHNVKAGVIKDLGAAAVLVASLFALMVGLIIFVPKLFW